MNKETLKGKAQELKGKLQNAWGKATHDPTDRVKGTTNEAAGNVRQKYGEGKEAAEDEFDDRDDNPLDASTDTDSDLNVPREENKNH